MEKISDVILRRIDKSGSECIFCSLMHVVHPQLTEDVLPMRIDGMKTGDALVSNLPRGQSQSDVLEYLQFRGGKPCIFMRDRRSRSKECLRHALTDETAATAGIEDALANLLHRRVLKQNAEMGTERNNPAHEIAGELKTEENPTDMRKTSVEYFQVIDIPDVEKRVVKHHHGIIRLTEPLNKTRLVRDPLIGNVRQIGTYMHQACAGDVLVVCKYDFHAVCSEGHSNHQTDTVLMGGRQLIVIQPSQILYVNKLEDIVDTERQLEIWPLGVYHISPCREIHQ